MNTPKHLSNQELLDEMRGINNPSWSTEELERKNDLYEETLRRLNEPWRKIKE